MHETHLVADLVSKVESIALAERATEIVALDIWLGALCHMDELHFKDHFAIAAAGTIAQHAKVRVTLSTDINHPDALGVVLQRVEIASDKATKS